MRHPAAELIEEEMAERGWDIARLATEMGYATEAEYCINYLSVELFLACAENVGIRIGAQTAEKFGRAFGTGSQFWLNMDAAYLKQQGVGV